MSLFGFSVVVVGLDMDNEFQSASIECLPYESLVGTSGGVTVVEFELESNTPQDAVLRVISDLRSVNVNVVRIEHDLVSLSDIADRVENGHRETVRLWSLGKRRSNFPSHHTTVGGSRLWVWSEVHAWLSRNKIEISDIYPFMPLPVDVIESFNGAFAINRSKSTAGWMEARGATTPLNTGPRNPIISGGWRAAQ